jgi:hypothetical protein
MLPPPPPLPRYTSVKCALVKADGARGDIGHSNCVRTALERVVADAQATPDVALLIAFEVVFILLSIRTFGGDSDVVHGNNRSDSSS